MPKTRQQKEKVLKDLELKLKNAKSAALTVFSSLPVSADRQLRQTLFNENMSYAVVKKTLLIKAFEEMGFSSNQIKELKGNISLAISDTDEVAPAKFINNFAKDASNMTIVGGILENQWIDQAKVLALAKLPDKDDLIAQTVGTIKAPLTGLANVLAANLRALLNVLNAIGQ